METQEIVQNQVPYQPTADQVERAARLRRFNLLFVYLPVGLLAAAMLALIVIMLIMAINPPQDGSLLLLSGLADATLILVLCPGVIVGAALIALFGYAFGQARARRMAPILRTQSLLWRLDALLGRAKTRTEATTGLAVRPFLTIHGAVAYLRTLINQLSKMVKRS